MNSSSFASWKTGIISGFAFFLTVTILSIGYATLSTGLTTADKVGVGSGLTATAWNKLVDSIIELDGRTSNLSSSGTKVGIGTTNPQVTFDVNGTARLGSVTSGGVCLVEGAQGYDYTSHTPAYCSQSGVWQVPGLGFGQTWHDMTGSAIGCAGARAANGVVCTNNTGKPITVILNQYSASAGATTIWSINGVQTIWTSSAPFANYYFTAGNIIIPAGATYSASSTASTIVSWFELR